MKNQAAVLLIFLFSLLIAFTAGRYYGTVNSDFKDTIAPKIEQIVIGNDSILRINDSINFKIVEVEKTYEKTINNIMFNTPNDDYNFFSAYIERYCNRSHTDSTEIR